MDAAKEEFLHNGYENASMRAIAGKVGVSATALYRHFADKEALFCALIEPVLQEFSQANRSHDADVCKRIESGDPTDVWRFSATQFPGVLHYVYDHFDVFKLLTCCAAGTRYSDFQHELVQGEVRELLRMYRIARDRGLTANELDADDLHLIMSGFFSSLFELIIHDYSREDAVRRCEVLIRFFYSGLRAVLGF